MAATLIITNGHGVVTLEGDLTVQQADEVKQVLQNALQQTEHISLVAKNVRNADVAGLQLLCSAHRTAMKADKQLLAEEALSDALKRAVEEAGFSRPSGCGLDRTKTCLWVSR